MNRTLKNEAYFRKMDAEIKSWNAPKKIPTEELNRWHPDVDNIDREILSHYGNRYLSRVERKQAW